MKAYDLIGCGALNLDLIYRLAVPLFPPLLTTRLADRMFAIFSFELKETFMALSDYPEG